MRVTKIDNAATSAPSRSAAEQTSCLVFLKRLVWPLMWSGWGHGSRNAKEVRMKLLHDKEDEFASIVSATWQRILEGRRKRAVFVWNHVSLRTPVFDSAQASTGQGRVCSPAARVQLISADESFWVIWCELSKFASPKSNPLLPPVASASCQWQWRRSGSFVEDDLIPFLLC